MGNDGGKVVLSPLPFSRLRLAPRRVPFSTRASDENRGSVACPEESHLVP